MGTRYLHDLPDVLAGVPNVSTYAGWSQRSNRYGGYDAVRGIAIHHTASNWSPEKDMYYQWVSAESRPIGAIYLGRDGRIVIGAAGATNCQGVGGPLRTSMGVIPQNKGNQYMIAIEAANAGTGEMWPTVQTDQYVRLVRALCDGYGFVPQTDVYGHFDYCAPSCPGRKIDPAGPSPFGSVNKVTTWDIDAFRQAVIDSAEPPEPPPEDDDMYGTATVWFGHQLHLFERGEDSALWHDWTDADGVWRRESLGGQITSSPSAAARPDGVGMDITARGTDGRIYHTWFDGEWRGWEPVATWP